MKTINTEQKNDASRKNRVKLKFRHRHPFIFYSMVSVFLSTLFGVVAVVSYVNHVIGQTPMITEEQLMSTSTSNMYDIKGRKIWSDTEQVRDYVDIENVPKSYIDILLAVEDSEFYDNKGVSKKGIFNAFYTTIMSKIDPNIEARGGSTIDQQLLKNSSDEIASRSTIERKLMEWWRAYQMNENFSKDKILEYYINKIFLGEGSYGAETIAITYFGKTLKDLEEPTPENLSKLAIIVGLGQAPSTYNLYDNPDAVEARRNEVLIGALNKGVLKKSQIDEIKKIPVTDGLKDRFWRNTEIQATVKAYNSYIDSALAQVREMGYDYKKTPIQIYTHLDTDRQDWLNAQINDGRYYDGDGQQIATTVVETQTGIVLAQSGGRNEEAYGLNRATQRTRSSGSSTKPFISYGPAIEYFGYGSSSTFDSSHYLYPGTNIVASNFGGATYGTVDMTFSLKLSLNTPALRLLDEVVGSTYSKEFLSKIGLDVKDTYGGSDALGIDISTSQEAAAFAAIANKGMYRAPQYVKSLVFSDGSTKEIEIKESRGMKESTAYILAKMLEQTMTQGGSAMDARIGEFRGHFAKTGTVAYDSSDGIWRPDMASSDKWIAGATKSVSVSIWTGYDKPNEPGNWLLIDGRGYTELYTKIMRHFNTGRDTSAFSQPSTVNGSGLSLYPNDTSQQVQVWRPDFSVAQTDESLFDTKSKKFKFSVTKKERQEKIPTDYKYQSWVKELSDENVELYGDWIVNPEHSPRLSDVTDVSDVYNTTDLE